MSYKCFEGYGNLGEQKGFDIIHTIINCIDIKKMHRSIEPIDENASIGEFKCRYCKRLITASLFR